MICSVKGNLRHCVRTKTALATVALVAGGYLVTSGTAAKADDFRPFRAGSQEEETNKADVNTGTTATQAAKPTVIDETSVVTKSPQTQPDAAAVENAAPAENIVKVFRGNPQPEENFGEVGGPASVEDNTIQEKEIQVSPGGSLDDNAAAGFRPFRAEARYEEKYSEQKTNAEGQVGSIPASGGSQPPNGDVALGPFQPFRPDPKYDKKYDTEGQVDIYGGKSDVEPPRPPIEIGRQQYTSGEYGESSTLLGELNPLLPGLAVYGDWRTAVAYNQNNGDDIAQIATRLNIDVDLKLTGTERLHAFFTPLQDNAKFTRFEFGGDAGDGEFTLEFDPNPQTLFFEGDAGALYSGFSGQQAGFDLPFTVGLFPLFLQNGIWANDAILGGAFTIPAQNSPTLGLSNYDVTFFAAFDNVDNQSVIADVANRNNNIANLYGVTAFIDAFGGYIETGYGLIQGRDEQDGLLTNFLTAAYTKRYGNTLSNTTRVFGNFGEGDDNDGVAVISENSLISGLPSTLLPYANFFVGFGAPQPLVSADGILKNVGINFETDALTGFPKLNDTGSNAYGGAIGLQYLFNLDQQIVIEAATVQPFGTPVVGVGAVDPEYALGLRYQIPLTKAWLLRADATYQIKEGQDEDDFGIRTEIRRKF